MKHFASQFHTKNLSQALDGHNNSLGLIRLTLASLVLVDHAFPLGGFGEDPFLFFSKGQETLGSLAVGGFFAISGYLIAKSGASCDFVQFLWRRTIRIFPGYWLVLLVTAFLVAPIIWVSSGNSLDESFFAGPNGPFQYLISNWTLHIGSFGVHDIFTNSTPWGKPVMNGSLWTLIYEWNCYLIIAALVAFGLLANFRIVVPIIAVFFLVLRVLDLSNNEYVNFLAPTFIGESPMIQMGFIFMVGAVFATYSNKILFDDRLGVFSGLVALATLYAGGFAVLGSIFACYFVLYVAARLPKRFQWIGQKNDYSYGVYIYGFLVQQILSYIGVYKWGYFPYLVLSWLVSMGFAWLSWHLIEQRALSLKNWGPGKGLKYWTGIVQGIKTLRT